MQPGSYPGQQIRPAHERVRRHPRRLLTVPIRLHQLVVGGIRTSRGISLDISEGGIGVLVEGGIEAGNLVEIELELPGRALNAVAIVRHSCSARSGCEFVGLRAEERAYLAQVVGRA